MVSGIFLSPEELYWHDPTGCVDKTKELIELFSSNEREHSIIPWKALGTIYPGLYDFFVNVCGVPKTPTSGSYLQMLLQLSSSGPPSQATHVVSSLYIKSQFTNGFLSSSLGNSSCLYLYCRIHVWTFDFIIYFYLI